MEKIIKYKADDGLEFTDKSRCTEHEDNCLMAANIMLDLPNIPEGSDFSNGCGYIQHDKDCLLAVRNELLEFFKRYSDHKWIQETIDKGFDAHASYVSRIIGESAPSPISKHWYRFECIDYQFREWGQPYYANNPEEGEQIQLN